MLREREVPSSLLPRAGSRGKGRVPGLMGPALRGNRAVPRGAASPARTCRVTVGPEPNRSTAGLAVCQADTRMATLNAGRKLRLRWSFQERQEKPNLPLSAQKLLFLCTAPHYFQENLMSLSQRRALATGPVSWRRVLCPRLSALCQHTAQGLICSGSSGCQIKRERASRCVPAVTGTEDLLWACTLGSGRLPWVRRRAGDWGISTESAILPGAEHQRTTWCEPGRDLQKSLYFRPASGSLSAKSRKEMLRLGDGVCVLSTRWELS